MLQLITFIMLQLEGDNYIIRGESRDFANRQKSIFDQLDAVTVKQDSGIEDISENDGTKFMKTDVGRLCTDSNVSKKEKKLDTKHFKGKESIFKRPEVPPPPRFKRTIPDYQRNPHKWVKYDLSDISQEDMSDKSNTAAALSFLNEIRARKQNVEEPMDADNKITFKKPNKFKNKATSSGVIKLSSEDSPGEDGTSYFRGSKLVMPEYVVGEKKKKVIKHHDKSESSEMKTKTQNEIKLNHLMNYDDDDDDDELNDAD